MTKKQVLEEVKELLNNAYESLESVKEYNIKQRSKDPEHADHAINEIDKALDILTELENDEPSTKYVNAKGEEITHDEDGDEL